MVIIYDMTCQGQGRGKSPLDNIFGKEVIWVAEHIGDDGYFSRGILPIQRGKVVGCSFIERSPSDCFVQDHWGRPVEP